MHKLQIAGVVLVLVGLFVLFLLRDPLYSFMVVVIQLIGVFIGILLVVIGVALVLGGTWMRRGPPRGWGSTALPIHLHDG